MRTDERRKKKYHADPDRECNFFFSFFFSFSHFPFFSFYSKGTKDRDVMGEITLEATVDKLLEKMRERESRRSNRQNKK